MGAARLVTLSGAGGVGKTRLALEVARGLVERFEDGVWLVELAGVGSGEGVARAATSALGVREQPDRPPLRALVEALCDRSMLMVLDNCEHLLEECAELAEAVGRDCPQVRFLATSREGLGVEGEHVWRVPSLSVPPNDGSDGVEALAGFGAVALFVDRARAQQHNFSLDRANAAPIVSICRRLDGIPLAVELVAARLRSLPLNEIVHRLDDGFNLLTVTRRSPVPRHRTLEAAVEWSYNLIDERERSVLCRLSVFPAGWDLDAAGAVCGDIEPTDVVDLVGSLVYKSLVQTEPVPAGVRYHLLEAVRQYAANRLDQRGEPERGNARRAHAEHYLALAESAAPHLVDAEQAEWLAKLELDHDNLRAGFAYFIADAQGIEPALRLGAALKRFWYIRGYYREGAEFLEAALNRDDAQRPDLVRAATLNRGRWNARAVRSMAPRSGPLHRKPRYRARAQARPAHIPLAPEPQPDGSKNNGRQSSGPENGGRGGQRRPQHRGSRSDRQCIRIASKSPNKIPCWRSISSRASRS